MNLTLSTTQGNSEKGPFLALFASFWVLGMDSGLERALSFFFWLGLLHSIYLSFTVLFIYFNTIYTSFRLDT